MVQVQSRTFPEKEHTPCSQELKSVKMQHCSPSIHADDNFDKRLNGNVILIPWGKQREVFSVFSCHLAAGKYNYTFIMPFEIRHRIFVQSPIRTALLCAWRSRIFAPNKAEEEQNMKREEVSEVKKKREESGEAGKRRWCYNPPIRR